MTKSAFWLARGRMSKAAFGVPTIRPAPAGPEKAGILPEAGVSGSSPAARQAVSRVARRIDCMHFQDGVVPVQAIVPERVRPYILSIAISTGVRNV